MLHTILHRTDLIVFPLPSRQSLGLVRVSSRVRVRVRVKVRVSVLVRVSIRTNWVVNFALPASNLHSSPLYNDSSLKR